MSSRYYDTTCCPDDGLVTPWEKCSFSREFCGAQVITNDTLLGISGKGGYIHSVDVDVRCDKNDGVQLVRDAAEDVLYSGGSRDWDGAVDIDNKPLPSNDFQLTLDDADECVVISWTEIV